MASIDSTIWDMDPHTRAKHQILEEYLKAWFPILSKWFGRIIYLDGFAGPGVYSRGEEGSPVIAIRTALDHKLRERFREIVFWFIEKDSDRAQRLREVLQERFPSLPSNLTYEAQDAEFAPTLESVLNELEKQDARLAPTFAFLDPFGFSGLPMKLIGRMLAYQKCEVLITFMAGFVNRFTDELRGDALDELFAAPEWREARNLREPEDRQRFLVDLYVKQLREVGGAQYVRTFEMRGEKSQLIYHLVFGTKHWMGLKAMKEAMFKVDRRGTYRFSDRTDPRQVFLIDYSATRLWVPRVANMVFERFKGKTVGCTEVEQFVIADTPYIFRKSTLRHLEESVPPRIVHVEPRGRRFSYPEHCLITFSG